MKLSIIIPYYKKQKYLLRNIKSIITSYNISKKQLDYEIIIVIDSIEDKEIIEKLVLEKFPEDNILFVKNHTNLGVARSRNNGLRFATGDFVTFIDQDDFVDDNYFEILEKQLDLKYDLFIINGYFLDEVHNFKIPIFCFKPKLNFLKLLKYNSIKTPGLIIYNRRIKSLIYFIDESRYKGTDDWGCLLNLLLQKKVNYKFINRKIFYYSFNGENYGLDVYESRMSAYNTLKFFQEKFTLHSKATKILKKRKEILLFEIYFYSSIKNKKFKLILSNLSIFLNLVLYKLDVNKICNFIYKKLLRTKYEKNFN